MNNFRPPRNLNRPLDRTSRLRSPIDSRLVRLVATILIWAAAFYFIEHEWSYCLSLELEDTEAAEATQLDERVENGSIQRKLAFPVVGLTGLILLLTQVRVERPKLSLNFWVFLAYAAWTFASIAWTADMALTIRRLVVFGCVVVAAIGFRQQFRNADCLIFVVAIALIHLAVGLAAEAAHGRASLIGADYRFAGTVHPNTQAIQLGAAGLAALCLMGRSDKKRFDKRWMWAGLYLIILAVVVLTRSRTALGSFLLASLIVAVPLIPKRLRCLAFLAPASIASLTAVTILILDLRIARKIEAIIFLGRVEETGTLTGRTDIWQAMLRYFWDQPVFGYGYGGFWTPSILLDLGNELDFQPAHAHNAYLQTMLDVGVIGFAILAVATAIAVYSALRTVIQQPENVHARFFFGLFVMGLVFSFLDTSFVIPGFVNVITFAGLMSTFGDKPPDTHSRWNRVAEAPPQENQFREVRR